MSFVVGANVGPYRIIHQLGQGGMATVYKAYHAALDRFVAIKVLHPAFLEEPNFLKRFQREAQVIARLEHAHIVPVYDFNDHNGQPYLVMKFIEGETLKARLSRGQLPKDEGRKVIEAVGKALAHAHSQGVLHRDIKPSNVLLAPDGGIYLADFGLARIAQAGESTLSSDQLLGTPHYISPEQARGDKDLDAGTDIYSLGVVLYELIVGRVPFSADTPFSIIHDHIYAPLPPPRSINPHVPEAMERLLMKALAKDRSHRFASVQEMTAAFLSAMDDGDAGALAAGPAAAALAVSAPQAASASGDPPAPAGPRRRRRPWLWAGAGLMLACSCSLIFLAVASTQAPAEGREQTRAASVEETSEPAPGPTASPAPSRLPPTTVFSPLDQLRATARANPDDPEAQLQLAQAYYELRLEEPALQAVLRAGELFIEQGQSVRAAEVLATALKRSGGPDRAAPELVELAVQALFLSAPFPEGAPIFNRLRDDYPQWKVLLPISARAMAYRSLAGPALELLERSPGMGRGDSLSLAVLAELQWMNDRPEEARATAEAALADSLLPLWLKEHVVGLLARIDPGEQP